MIKKSIEQYVHDMVKWFHTIKLSKEASDRSFSESKEDFNKCMEMYFDAVSGEDGKLEVDVEDIKNVKKIVVTKVTPSSVDWDVEKIKSLLSPKEKKLVIQKNYTVINWKGLFELLKNSGVDFKEFLKYVNVTETVREKQLDKLIELGALDEEEVKECSSVKLKSSYYRLMEK